MSESHKGRLFCGTSSVLPEQHLHDVYLSVQRGPGLQGWARSFPPAVPPNETHDEVSKAVQVGLLAASPAALRLAALLAPGETLPSHLCGLI